MKRSEYEQRRRALDEMYEADLAALRAAHSVRLRTLEALWLANPEEDLPPSPAIAPPSPSPPRPAVPLSQALEDIFPRLPEVFDKSDVVHLLGWEPPRSSLFRVLQVLVEQGRLTTAYGSGRVSNVYRKRATPPPDV